jgi:ribose transport system substrate-binding protein
MNKRKNACGFVLALLMAGAWLPELAYAKGEMQATGKKDITVICMALNSDFWHMVEAGAKAAGKEFGYNVNVMGPNSESDYLGQMNMIEDAVTNKVGAIVLSPNDSKAVIPSVEKAKAANVPVILIGAELLTDDKTLFKSLIATVNYEAGKIAGNYLVERLKRGDKVAIIRGILGTPNHDQRSGGAADVLKAAGIEVVAIQSADSDMGKAVNVTENILQNNPDLKGIYATSDEMAIGALNAVKNAQKLNQIVVLGFDGTYIGLDSIEAGELAASIAQKPIDMGYLGVKTAIDVIEGRAVPDFIDSGTDVIEKSNVAAYRKNLQEQLNQVK